MEIQLETDILYVTNIFKLYIEFFKWLIFYGMYFICEME